MAFGKMIDLQMDEGDGPFPADMPFDLPRPSKKHYPYGLVIRLDEKTLEKMGLDCDCDAGDFLDMRCFGTVTVVHKEEGNRSVSIQIEKIQLENESQEMPGNEPEEEKD